tara:strand:+ start:10834 stop:11676 length:843 start_codon:yes stop_codon:yes gene_type:complete
LIFLSRKDLNKHFILMIDFKNKLLVKYSLEFIVIVVGISVTFWIDEWNRNRLEEIQHIKDIESIIDDLENDSLVIDRVNISLDSGKIKTEKLIVLIEDNFNSKLNYKNYYNKIIDIGYLWTYQTFFMTDATYKSLISNGRINLFPQQIHSSMNKYYEAIAKRINDHNKIVDDIAIRYYNYYHPFLTLFSYENFRYNVQSDVRLGVVGSENSFKNNTIKKFDNYFESKEAKEHYTSIDFYTNTINLRNRAGNYSRRIFELDVERKQLFRLLKEYLEELQSK